MSTRLQQQRDGRKLLRDGWSDEDVERLTGLSFESILMLRGEAAAASYGCGKRTLETPGLIREVKDRT